MESIRSEMQRPLALYEEVASQIDEVEMETGTLLVISPTDCVKDRLAWFYHDSDRQCLGQAILVAKNHPVDMTEIEKWSEGEGKRKEFEEILDQFPGVRMALEPGRVGGHSFIFVPDVLGWHALGCKASGGGGSQ